MTVKEVISLLKQYDETLVVLVNEEEIRDIDRPDPDGPIVIHSGFLPTIANS